MSKIEQIEQQIERLSPEELAKLREWFVQFDAEAWDRELESDSISGRLDSLAEQALRDHAAGKSTPL